MTGNGSNFPNKPNDSGSSRTIQQGCTYSSDIHSHNNPKHNRNNHCGIYNHFSHYSYKHFCDNRNFAGDSD